MKKKISEISDLINIRNYIYYQIENPKTNKKTSFKLIEVLSDLDNKLNEEIINQFKEEKKE